MTKALILALTGLSVLIAGAASAHETRPDPAAMMQRLDLNKDGKVTRAEFIRAAAQRPQHDHDDRRDDARRGNPERMFQRLDRNNDGVLTKAELSQAKPRKKG
ncbi:hypothetical protein [Paracoccus homiensis]|uniref:hypothetical protein n=1 Tax=Paracoccus homiensis TaxID=364199 RepID=UPI00398C93AF